MKVNITDYGEDRVEEVHIDPWDTWSLDHTLALIIIPALKQHKKQNIGHPILEPEDCAHSEKDLEDDDFDYTCCCKQWDELLDKMIYSFEKIIDEDYIFDKRTDLKIQEGLNYFGKYFRALWE